MAYRSLYSCGGSSPCLPALPNHCRQSIIWVSPPGRRRLMLLERRAGSATESYGSADRIQLIGLLALVPQAALFLLHGGLDADLGPHFGDQLGEGRELFPGFHHDLERLAVRALRIFLSASHLQAKFIQQGVGFIRAELDEVIAHPGFVEGNGRRDGRLADQALAEGAHVVDLLAVDRHRERLAELDVAVDLAQDGVLVGHIEGQSPHRRRGCCRTGRPCNRPWSRCPCTG